MTTEREELHYRVMLLKKALEENKISIAEHLIKDFQESLSKIKFAEDGLVIPETVDGRIRSMSLLLLNQEANSQTNDLPSQNEEEPLLLTDNLPEKVEVDLEKISKFTSEDDFLELLVEISKEISTIIILLFGTYKTANNQPRKLTRNEAIFVGLLVRIAKLNNSFLNQVCERRTDIVLIFTRCIFETIVNLKFLVLNNSKENFDNYIKYSLKTEKKLLDLINKNAKERGDELGIETSMKASVMESFDISGFTPEDINENERTSYWCKNTYEKAVDVGMKELYLGLMSLPSHSIHGNWQDLIINHILYEEDGFSPRFEPIPINSSIIIGTELLIADISKFYTQTQLLECEDKKVIINHIDDFMNRIHSITEIYNKFRFSAE